MACILQPECNFLHSCFRCHTQVEMVDVEVRMTSMQGTNMFRRDRTCQLIKCNPWSTRLCPHPTIIKKMKTYLELEGKLEPKPQSQSNQFRPPLLYTNPQIRKESKATEKRIRLIPTKKYKVKVVARPGPRNATTQLPQTNAKDPVNPEIQKPSTSENNPPPFEDTSVCASTPWPKAGKMSGNLFELRKDWPIPPTNNAITTTNPKPPVKIKPQEPDQPNPNAPAPKPE